MELQFKKESISCLHMAMRDVQNIEETQELRLSDGMPDVGRVLSAWGQIILRGKEWLNETVSLSGGMMVWVLYLPDDGSELRCIDTWVPFQIRWDLPANTPEGTIRTECLTRFVDARSVSARKIMLRCGVAAMAEVYTPMMTNVYVPENIPEDVQLLRHAYPVCLPQEAGEKSFQMEEDHVLPASACQIEKLIYYRMTPVLTDQKVLVNKVVFRGNLCIHMLYASEDGQLCCWDHEMPFSQFAELTQSHSNDAQADILLGTTGMEIDLDEEGQLHVKCSMVSQYLIRDTKLLELVEDAYSTTRELKIEEEELKLPAVLESRQEKINAEQSIPVNADLVADACFLPDFPRQKRTDDRIRLEMPGFFQILYYAEDGSVQTGVARWEGAVELPCHANSQLTAIPGGKGDVQIFLGNGSVTLRTEPELQVTATSDKGVSVVAGIGLGEEKSRDENRPSLILCRAGQTRLWDMAKMSGSTVEAIRKANSIAEEPYENQMLLIPIT